MRVGSNPLLTPQRIRFRRSRLTTTCGDSAAFGGRYGFASVFATFVRHSRRTLKFAICGAVALHASSALAGPASDFVRSNQTSACALLEASHPDQKRITALFDQMIDYAVIARASLGTDWEFLTTQQHVEFTSLLRQLVIRAYENQLTRTSAYRFDHLSLMGRRTANHEHRGVQRDRSPHAARSRRVDLARRLLRSASVAPR